MTTNLSFRNLDLATSHMYGTSAQWSRQSRLLSVQSLKFNCREMFLKKFIFAGMYLSL